MHRRAHGFGTLGRLFVAVVVDPDDPGAVVQLVFEQQEARAVARVQGHRQPLRSRGRPTSARRSEGFSPSATPDAIYAASAGGSIIRIDAATGKVDWRIDAGKRLSVGVGADPTLVVVGTDRGDVLAFTPDGKPLWTTAVTSEVLGPPRVAEGIVVVRSGDGRMFGLSGADGKTKWVYQQATPPLTVRNFAGGVVSRGGLFIGTAGGKLLAVDLATGNIGWEGNVATPKGATELERIADVTSLPVVEERQACAVAYQGRIACFDILRGNLNWSRDLSSLAGIVTDARYLYVTDDRGAVHALDKATGASAWKQDKLAARRPGGPQLVGDYVGVVDVEGYLHVLDRNDGSLVGRVATDGTAADGTAGRSGRQCRLAERRRDGLLRHRALRSRIPNGTGAATGASPPQLRRHRARELPTDCRRCCPPLSSSVARTSASRRCSIDLPAPARRWSPISRG